MSHATGARFLPPSPAQQKRKSSVALAQASLGSISSLPASPTLPRAFQAAPDFMPVIHRGYPGPREIFSSHDLFVSSRFKLTSFPRIGSTLSNGGDFTYAARSCAQDS
jgi:hypothetical protein